MAKEFFTGSATGRSSDEVSLADIVFESWDSFDSNKDGDVDENNNNENDDSSSEKCKAFWEEKDQLLKGILCRTSSCEKKVREATKEIMREMDNSEMVCSCRRQVVAKNCRNCMLKELCHRLLNLGYNCAICKSKWRSSSEIISGEHSYLEVREDLSKSKREVKVVIELSFRGEFEMACANEEYKELIKRLPEVFVGKAERLRALVKIMCSAAKRCMKEKKMHIGPWRKHKYMEAKWFGTCERSTMEPLLLMNSATRQPKPKASMLTFDLLLDNIQGLHCTTVEVV
ncbi:uncharacterized protein HKW66_Vig0145630 [Vigna angularis]|uniref:Uncharacterized protein n=2 Tax=Phaseolus angularis TaxID=3914 RepID=A0A8T0KCE4_PHAAN|nr:uncharacterized protein LOC108339359 [Vigna angularis]KAG2397201.1 uncharacterized protein HKW66_Vig0145630 [Vigna angularis]